MTQTELKGLRQTHRHREHTLTGAAVDPSSRPDTRVHSLTSHSTPSCLAICDSSRKKIVESKSIFDLQFFRTSSNKGVHLKFFKQIRFWYTLHVFFFNHYCNDSHFGNPSSVCLRFLSKWECFLASVSCFIWGSVGVESVF